VKWEKKKGGGKEQEVQTHVKHRGKREDGMGGCKETEILHTGFRAAGRYRGRGGKRRKHTKEKKNGPSQSWGVSPLRKRKGKVRKGRRGGRTKEEGDWILS